MAVGHCFVRRLAGWRTQQMRGKVLGVWKKLPDGSWKLFRAMGGTEPGTTGKMP